jgi:hypothetical protein
MRSRLPLDSAAIIVVAAAGALPVSRAGAPGLAQPCALPVVRIAAEVEKRLRERSTNAKSCCGECTCTTPPRSPQARFRPTASVCAKESLSSLLTAGNAMTKSRFLLHTTQFRKILADAKCDLAPKGTAFESFRPVVRTCALRHKEFAALQREKRLAGTGTPA